MAWNASKPGSSDGVSASVEDIKANWVALEAFSDVEHTPISSADPGLHDAGVFGALAACASAPVITDAGNGALAFDYTNGVMYSYSTQLTAWQRDMLSANRVIVKGEEAQLILHSGTRLNCDNEIFDPLTAYTDDVFTAPYGGFYLIEAEMSWTGMPSGYDYELRICKNSTVVSYATKRMGTPLIYTGPSTTASGYFHSSISDVVELSIGDTIVVCAHHTYLTDEVTGVSKYLSIVRLQ